MSNIEATPGPSSAIVVRPASAGVGQESYLQLDEQGRPGWTCDPASATSFASMREAARVAFRLPAGIRAYGLPRSVELSLKPA